MGADWSGKVEAMTALLDRGDEVSWMEQVTGEEGISLDDFVASQAAHFLDMVFLQQDAYDRVDSSASLARQKALFDKVHAIASRPYGFVDKEAARQHFTKMTGLFKNYNYAVPNSGDANRLLKDIDDLDATAPVARRM